MLKGKTILLGVTGGIAAYKAADLASKLAQAGAKVRVVMTWEATEFVSPLTFEALTGNPVVTEMFGPDASVGITHISLADSADVVAIVPATANIIAKIASGISDDMLTCVVLATKATVVVSPAMHNNMYINPITQENIAKLKKRGFTIVPAAEGRLASGGYGYGRLPDTSEIIGYIQQVLGRDGDLAGKYIVVTAGGTQEAIDPVRFISNRSSGKMGYALAEAARDRGACVTLIAAPASIPAPSGMEVVKVQSAAQMHDAVVKAVKKADALIMAAAVADYMPKKTAAQKIKKDAGGLTLELVKTPDIISEVKGKFLKVGFAAETENILSNAKKKLINKELDMIIANDVTSEGSGFGTDTNKVTIISRKGEPEDLPMMSKKEVAEKIMERVGKMLLNKNEVIVKLTDKMIRGDNPCIPIRKMYQHLFPKFGESLILITNVGEVVTNSGKCRSYNSFALEIRAGIAYWFKSHPELKKGDKLRITIVEPMKKYRLEIVKQPKVVA